MVHWGKYVFLNGEKTETKRPLGNLVLEPQPTPAQHPNLVQEGRKRLPQSNTETMAICSDQNVKSRMKLSPGCAI